MSGEQRIEIEGRHTGDVLFTVNSETLRGADLSRADLSRANLSGAENAPLPAGWKVDEVGLAVKE